MVENGIASASEFRCAVERTNVERIILPASGLSVLLCRPPVFAALEMGRIGTQLQARGLAPGEVPDLWNLSHPKEVAAVPADAATISLTSWRTGL